MPVKSIHSGRSISFGRRHPIAHFPSLHLENYLLKSLPNPPATSDYSSAAAAALSEMYLNDALGDCVIACQAHLVGVFTGNAGDAVNGSPTVFTRDQIISRYSAIGGYVPGNPATDNGCDMQTALASWQAVGMMPLHLPENKHRIQGWLRVSPSNIQQMQTALYLFENLDFGLDLPDAWVSPPPESSGFTWGVAGAPDPDNGHCVCGVGYGAQGVTIDTWGMLGTMTYAAIAEYCNAQAAGELYTVISKDVLNRAQQKAPTGFDWSQLIADFQAIATTAA
jgi:hypothetical protein